LQEHYLLSDISLLSKDAAANTRLSRVNLRSLGLIIYLLLVPVALFLAFSHWGYDDPFITYRYAENIRQGRGFVYNPGEQVLSTTTPLFALLLSFLSYVKVPIPYLAISVSSLSMALGGILIWDLGRTWKLPWVGWSGLLLYPTFPLLLSTSGSETPLYLALCLGAFAFYFRRRTFVAAVFSALAVLTRPDGVLVPVVLAGHSCLFGMGFLGKEGVNRIQIRTFIAGIPWASILVFVAIILPWFLFSWIYFGSLVPATLTVKQAQGQMAISQRFLPGLLTIISWYSGWPYMLQALLGLVGLLLLPGSARVTGLFFAWTVLYFTAYSILGVSRYFWYYAPLVPGFILAAGLGLSFINRERLKGTSLSSNLWRYMAPILLVLLLLGQMGTLIRMRDNNDSRLSIYRETGEWLAAHTGLEDTVGALEVGIIGFYAKRPMVDFAGLIQPQVARQINTHTTYEDSALWALEQNKPRYVALQEGLFPSLEQGYLSNYCLQVETISKDPYPYPYNIVIYTCQGPSG
jgi:hypothetical protein